MLAYLHKYGPIGIASTLEKTSAVAPDSSSLGRLGVAWSLRGRHLVRFINWYNQEAADDAYLYSVSVDAQYH